MVFRKLQSRPNLRVLFFFVALFAGSFLVMGISFATAWFVFHSRRISPAFAPLVLHPAWFVLIFVFRRYVDKKSVSSLGISLGRGWLQKLLAGILLAFLLILIVYLANLLASELKVIGFAWQFKSWYFILGLLVFGLWTTTIGPFMEELVFRGYAFSNLSESLGLNLAVLISSVLFAVGHIPNAGFNPLGIFNIFLFGVFLCLATRVLKTLWFAVGFHFAWNFSQGEVFGFPVYGGSHGALLVSSFGDRALLTGGTFGPEASIISTALLLTSIGLATQRVSHDRMRKKTAVSGSNADLVSSLVSPELQGKSTHYALAFTIARELGFSREEASIIGRECEEVDKFFKPEQNIQNYWRHFDPLAWLLFRRDSREFYANHYFELAVESGDVSHLGAGLHSLQDKYAHGLIPFQKDLPILRIFTGTWRDNPKLNPKAFKKTKSATFAYLAKFLEMRNKKQART